MPTGHLQSRILVRDVRHLVQVGDGERRLISVLQEGLPLFARPFALIAERVGASESTVLTRIGKWIEEGAIKRFGVVVRHHELGYTANAMLVHDVPDERVGELGRSLAEEPAVTLCYRRPRQAPQWPYNLFCMIHGRERAEVEGVIAHHPAVLLCSVVAKPDDKWGEVPCAFVELKEGATATEDEIIAFARARLAGFKTPKRVIFAELPKTSTGKIQKFELRAVAKLV